MVSKKPVWKPSNDAQISVNYLQIKVAFKILVFDLGLGLLIVEGPFKYYRNFLSKSLNVE